MALSRHSHHPPPSRSKKQRHLSRSHNDHASDPAILALQAQHSSHNISSSRDASEEDNDDDDDDLDDDEEEEEEDGQDDDDDDNGDEIDADDQIKAERRKAAKAERAARRNAAAAASRRHPSSDDADINLPSSSVPAATVPSLSATAAANEAATVSPSRRPSHHALQAHPNLNSGNHAQVSATLAYASAALQSHSTSSPSNDEGEGEATSSSGSQLDGVAPFPPTTGTTAAGATPSLLARRAPPTAAPSDAGANLHLGSLPDVKSGTAAVATDDAAPTLNAQNPVLSSLGTAGSATQTPKAQAAPVSALFSGPGGPAGASSTAAGAPQKKSKSNLHPPRAEDDEDQLTDGAGGTPYDGDVEYAARSAIPIQQNSNAKNNTGAGHGLSSSPSAGVPFPSTSSPTTTTTAAMAHPSSSTHAQQPSRSGTLTAYPHPISRNNEGSAPDDTPLTLPNGRPRPRNRLRSDASDKEHAILSAPKAPEEIRAYMRDCISGERAKGRAYAIKEPRDGGGTLERPIRIYADGVFDMFHYAHTLLLRQAKLFFPHVHLIAGVNSSTLCAEHKNRPLLSSEERYASVGACKWVDEVVVDAPWFITPEFIQAHKIDYVAHDDLPYANASSGSADVYGWLKEAGIFLPTLRTEGVSTSELLGRVVEVYQSHALDDKLRKVGLEKLIDSRSPSGSTTPAQQQQH
ncbi:choline-phosphate cytidylyltransferase [Tilletia horrida]|nr:choline-phosphate cytidylyltransferase [Tilletia horrida]